MQNTNSVSRDTSAMEASIDKASKRLGFSSLKGQQKRAITSFLDGNDVFVSLPTGSSKSLCFALLPFTFDDFLGREGNIAIAVSPLISLMKDQVGRLAGSVCLSVSLSLCLSLSLSQCTVYKCTRYVVHCHTVLNTH